VSTPKAYSNYIQHVDDLEAHGKLLTGGQMLSAPSGSPGYYVTPTIVTDLPADHPLWKQELFLPIVCVDGFDDPDAVMQRVNDVPFGLTSGIYAEEQEEIDWFFENVEAGVLYANRESGATTGAWPGYQPFGGWKGSSTTGRGSGGAHYLQQYLREQSQTVVK
jgi:1-pyrroline-5-carboxylate dehydrogenase